MMIVISNDLPNLKFLAISLQKLSLNKNDSQIGPCLCRSIVILPIGNTKNQRKSIPTSCQSSGGGIKFPLSDLIKIPLSSIHTNQPASKQQIHELLAECPSIRKNGFAA